LFQETSWFDRLVSAIALPVDVALRLVKRGWLREPAEVRAAWDEHGRHDSYLTLSEIRKTCADTLPGANVTRQLLWRYSIIWKKEQRHSNRRRSARTDQQGQIIMKGTRAWRF
jgi:hypothetical protein